MYTLPRNQKISIRDPDKATTRLLTKALGRWQGDRISVYLGDKFSVDAYKAWHWFNLYDGTNAVVNLAPGPHLGSTHAYRPSAQLYDVDHGLAWISAGRDKASDVTIHINQWYKDTQDYMLHAVTDVIRDAVLEQDEESMKRAIAIGRAELPHSYGLFISLIKREVNMLNKL